MSNYTLYARPETEEAIAALRALFPERSLSDLVTEGLTLLLRESVGDRGTLHAEAADCVTRVQALNRRIREGLPR